MGICSNEEGSHLDLKGGSSGFDPQSLIIQPAETRAGDFGADDWRASSRCQSNRSTSQPLTYRAVTDSDLRCSRSATDDRRLLQLHPEIEDEYRGAVPDRSGRSKYWSFLLNILNSPAECHP